MSIKRPEIRNGLGRVRSGDLVIENVTHELVVHREYQGSDASTGPETVRVTGRIEGGSQTDRKRLLDLSIPRRLTLEMKDGSKVDFYLESMGSGRIVVTGPIYRDDSY